MLIHDDPALPDAMPVPPSQGMSRRQSLRSIGLGAAAAMVAPQMVLAQAAQTPEPPSTVTTPPRSFAPDAAPNVYFWDPDVIAVDPSFNGLAQPNAPIRRLSARSDLSSSMRCAIIELVGRVHSMHLDRRLPPGSLAPATKEA